jgi:hypothetical protein
MERISGIFILLAAAFLESSGITFSAALVLLALYYLMEATLTPMVQQRVRNLVVDTSIRIVRVLLGDFTPFT